ncbi:hypothetical protein BIW11_02434 [Tropilaelaps mercedesae]|uniref:Uncharacterized protein n=1 Tax=Tropilaelaps mercedesae TaxID=418985 RepID=A0A1V9Y3N7_9ACAR|nr:hypothetical protein BIW11_02434 [Tropilaelaps mercedesae]
MASCCANHVLIGLSFKKGESSDLVILCNRQKICRGIEKDKVLQDHSPGRPRHNVALRDETRHPLTGHRTEVLRTVHA